MACTEKHASPKLALLAKLKDCKRSYHSTVAAYTYYPATLESGRCSHYSQVTGQKLKMFVASVAPIQAIVDS